jgi:hypothetical protein
VLVNGVAVVAVADNQGVDAVKFGDKHLKYAEGMHGAECLSGVGAEEDFAQ